MQRWRKLEVLADGEWHPVKHQLSAGCPVIRQAGQLYLDAVAAREIANGNAAIKHRYKRPMPCTPPSPRDSGLMTPTDGCLCSVPGPPAARWVWLFIDLVVRLPHDLKARDTASTKLESSVQAVCPAIHAGPGRVGRRSMVVRPCTGLQAAAPIFLKWHALSGR